VRRSALAAALLGIVLAAGAGADDGAIDRPLPRSPREWARAHDLPGGMSTEGLPSTYKPRAFPSVLRDPSRPTGPDGVLWRRLFAGHPDLSLRQLLTRRPVPAKGPRAASVDTVHVLVLRVDFLRDGGGAGSTTPDGRFDLTPRDSATTTVDPPPHNRDFFNSHFEALQRFYQKQSGGQLALAWDIYPTDPDSAYHLSDTADYGPWILTHGDAEILRLAEKLVRDAFAVADTSADPPDFRRYESFLLFHAGTDFQGDVRGDTPYDIPSFNVFLADPVVVQDSTCFITQGIMVVPETVTQDGYTSALNGVLAHEYGHQLGFFDLYDVLSFAPMVGMFSLMDSGENLYGTVYDSLANQTLFVRGAIPASVDPWQKLLFFPEGVQASWVTADSQFVLPPVQLHNQMALVPIGGQGVIEDPAAAPLIGSEYYILENRPYDLNGDGTVYLQADSLTGVFLGPEDAPRDSAGPPGAIDTLGAYEDDYLLPGSGVLVWHIDNAAIDAAFNYCYGCVNIFRERRGVDVEEADGIEDLGDIYSVEWTGGYYDYWFQGGYARFGPDTDPDTRTTAGGWTGIQVAVLDSAGPSLRVSVTRGGERVGWPRYIGSPLASESVGPADLDGDGTPEILAAGGNLLTAFEPDGQPYPFADSDGTFALAESLWLPGVCVVSDFVDGAGAPASILAAATPTHVIAWDAERNVRMAYPGNDAGLALRFTTAPLGLDSVLVVGDDEGRLRGLQPAAYNELLWRTRPPGFPVRAIAAGDVRGDGRTALAWGNSGGQIWLAEGWQQTGYQPAAGWPQRPKESDTSPVAWVMIQEGLDGAEGCILALSEAGTVTLLAPTGETLEGWPRSIGATPAGPPAIGDPDGDGILEYAVTDVDGIVHLFSRAGDSEDRWPRSVWHPDVTPYGPVLSGPLFADVTGDGRPELLQGSGDGTIHAFGGGAEEVSGWPRAVGYGVTAGPMLAGTGTGGALELLAADAGGFATLLLPAFEARAMIPGEMWRSDTGPERRHAYRRAWLPVPSGTAELLDPARVFFTPNPIVGSRGALRVHLGQSATLRLRLYDTRGRRAWEGSYRPDDIEEDIVWPLDLKDLAPGLYVARIVAEGDGQDVRLLRKLAVVR
jgi:M6 family metalloprotease-like protein